MLGEVCVQEGALQLEATGIQVCSCPPGGGGEDGSNPAQIQPRGPCDSPVPRKPHPKTGRRGHTWGCLAPPPLSIPPTVPAPGTRTQLQIWAFDGVGCILASTPRSCGALTSSSTPWRPSALICKMAKGGFGGKMCVRALPRARPAPTVAAVAAGGCWVRVSPGRTRASGLARDRFLVLEPPAGPERGGASVTASQGLA